MDNDHPLVKHRGKIIKFLDYIKQIIDDGGDEMNIHLDGSCLECEAVANEIKEKIEEIGLGLDICDDIIETGIIDESDQ